MSEKLVPKGRKLTVVIPLKVQETLNVKAGDRVIFTIEGEKVCFSKDLEKEAWAKGVEEYDLLLAEVLDW